jgi:predicted metal-dependent phosphoesterase TrpH
MVVIDDADYLRKAVEKELSQLTESSFNPYLAETKPNNNRRMFRNNSHFSRVNGSTILALLSRHGCQTVKRPIDNVSASAAAGGPPIGDGCGPN